MEFHVKSYVGIVYKDDDGAYFILDEELGKRKLAEEMSSSDAMVEVFVHHAPPDPLVRSKWGGGCCMWESSGRCPSGHHERPGYLYSVNGKGKLVARDHGWTIESKGTEDVPIYLSMLEGHRCRVAIVPCEFPSLDGEFDPSNIGDLMNRVSSLRQFIEAAKKAGGS